ncbi:MAG: polysaccharide biosynthesis protein [Bacilli bacterium]|nr:polysaccharide biosynthesis protein [Bacilli bacterium]
MKKNSFMQGAVIATFAIIFTKFIGIVYVIPFYKIIGDQGGALYGYAYTIYSTFLSLSTVGIPLAISKVVSEYNAKGYYHTRERVYKLGKRAIMLFALLIFLILVIFAEPLAKAIIGDIEGGNTIEDITFVIRVIATALLVIPSLAIARGYLQGNKYITSSSLSQVVEQLFRVIVVVFGSWVMLAITGNTTWAVSVACFGATIGGLIAYLYLKRNITKNKEDFVPIGEPKQEELKITTKEIWGKILKYAFPFVMIDVVGNACQIINMFTVVKILVNDTGFNVNDAEIVMSTLTTWGSKLCMVVTALATGLVVSLLPHITDSYVRKDKKTVTKYINQSYELLLYIAIPLTVGMSFLAKPIWEIFYGNHGLAAEVFSVFIFNGLTSALYTVTLTIMQSVDKYKVVFYSLFLEVIIKLILQYPLMILAYKIGIGPYCGNIAATITATCSTFIISMIYMSKKMNISLKESLITTMKIMAATLVMLVCLVLLNKVVPVVVSGRAKAIFIAILYGVVGAGIYFAITYKPIFKKVFGKETVNRILGKFKRKKSRGQS